MNSDEEAHISYIRRELQESHRVTEICKYCNGRHSQTNPDELQKTTETGLQDLDESV